MEILLVHRVSPSYSGSLSSPFRDHSRGDVFLRAPVLREPVSNPKSVAPRALLDFGKSVPTQHRLIFPHRLDEPHSRGVFLGSSPCPPHHRELVVLGHFAAQHCIWHSIAGQTRRFVVKPTLCYSTPIELSGTQNEDFPKACEHVVLLLDHTTAIRNINSPPSIPPRLFPGVTSSRPTVT